MAKRVFSFYQQFECPKNKQNWQKTFYLGSDTHISDVKMNPFNTIGPDVLHIWNKNVYK